MAYKNLEACIRDLEATQQLIRVEVPVNANLELAEIHRRVNQAKGPALFFTNITQCKFPVATNIYGTNSRVEYLFRDIIATFEKLSRLRADPSALMSTPAMALSVIPRLYRTWPSYDRWNQDILRQQCKVSELPQIKSWPDDGGSFITLPQVISFPPNSQKLSEANIGMYRIQMSGNDYHSDQELGLHYQIHRGIGIHHQAYNATDQEFKISIAVGGPPSHALASIFPLPEGMSEVLFTGLLGNRSYHYCRNDGYFIPTDVDFCITGIVRKNQLKKEGPFGDHLGYYSLMHDFPVLEIKRVFHKKNAIWHATVVGRPPQEDSAFGHIIHLLTRQLAAQEFPGVKSIHAVDEAGVHPLLLAIGSERYMPFRERKPEEILTQAFHILGKGQTSLSKYLLIAADGFDELPQINNTSDFFSYILERIDWKNDLHFITKTTIDTLDYSGEGLNAGSKLIWACNRNPLRNLQSEYQLPPISEISKVKLVQNGILALQIDPFKADHEEEFKIAKLCERLEKCDLSGFPLLILTDDAAFCAQNFSNFLWTTFTRSNPSTDIYGIKPFVHQKHWGCEGSLIIDARKKPHHAPELITDPAVDKKVDDLMFHHPELKKYLP